MVRSPPDSLNAPDLDSILRAALAAVDPLALVRAAVSAPGVASRLRAARAVDVIAAGKSADRMLAAIEEVLQPRRAVRAGLADASHPVPDERSASLGERALALAREASDGDLLLVLLSGGASSLLVAPADGISLDDTRETARQLLRRGATIREMNAVRKHLSAIKGGQLAAATRARVLTLAISDVVGNDLPVIGSGPTVADPSTFASALAVLDELGGRGAYPAAVVARLERGAAGEITDTPKPGSDVSARSEMRVIGELRTAIEGAAVAARGLGYRVHVMEEAIVGEAREAASRVMDAAMAARTDTGPLCVLSGGETTVTVRGPGHGGRNQELALAMVPLIERLGPGVIAASVGTDGIDGPTDAAGAIVDESTPARAQRAGLDVQAYLDDNNSYAFFDALGDLIRTGPTGTNVGDLQIVLWRV